MTTTIDWNELTPEQRDRLIDKKVIKSNDTEDEHTIAWTGSDMLLEITKQLLEKDDTTALPIPRYTTSMDAAWLVVKRFTVGVELSYTPGRDCCCKIQPVIGEPVYGIAENPAEAICIAALEATGYEVQQ